MQYFPVEGNSNIGLSQGVTYYVRPITPSSVELYSAPASVSETTTFDPTKIASNVIKGATGSTLTAGEAVTYLAGPAPFTFPTGDVDVNESDGSADVGAHNIYVGSAVYTTAEPVDYETNGTPLNVDNPFPFPGTTPLAEGTYYVILDGTGYIQLATTSANAMADKPILIDNTGLPVSNENALVSPPVGGLVNGQTYFVEIVSGGIRWQTPWAVPLWP